MYEKIIYKIGIIQKRNIKREQKTDFLRGLLHKFNFIFSSGLEWRNRLSISCEFSRVCSRNEGKLEVSVGGVHPE